MVDPPEGEWSARRAAGREPRRNRHAKCRCERGIARRTALHAENAREDVRAACARVPCADGMDYR
jgi:hypothetical protein